MALAAVVARGSTPARRSTAAANDNLTANHLEQALASHLFSSFKNVQRAFQEYDKYVMPPP